MQHQLPPRLAASGGRRFTVQPPARSSRRAPPPLVVVVLARDGKKRRSKQQQPGAGGAATPASGSAPAPAPAAAPAPPRRPPQRVDPNLNVSVGLQIQWAKGRKQREAAAAGGGFQQKQINRKFTRKPVDPDEQRKRKRALEREAQYVSELAQLEVMFDTKLDAPGEQPVGVTMIDGYNLMHRWAERQGAAAQVFATALRRRGSSDSDSNSGEDEAVEAVEVAPEWESGGELEVGREHLLQMLDVYSQQCSMYVHVVFDAMHHGATSTERRLGMRVSFRGGEEADTFIMRQAREYKDTGVKKVCIVTDDYLLKDLAVGGESEDAGQKVMFATSCATLIRAVEESKRKLAEDLRRSQAAAAATSARRIGNSVDSSVLGKMLSMRHGLIEAKAERAAEQREEERRRRQEQRRVGHWGGALQHGQAGAGAEDGDGDSSPSSSADSADSSLTEEDPAGGQGDGRGDSCV